MATNNFYGKKGLPGTSFVFIVHGLQFFSIINRWQFIANLYKLMCLKSWSWAPLEASYLSEGKCQKLSQNKYINHSLMNANIWINWLKNKHAFRFLKDGNFHLFRITFLLFLRKPNFQLLMFAWINGNGNGNDYHFTAFVIYSLTFTSG